MGFIHQTKHPKMINCVGYSGFFFKFFIVDPSRPSSMFFHIENSISTSIPVYQWCSLSFSQRNSILKSLSSVLFYLHITNRYFHFATYDKSNNIDDLFGFYTIIRSQIQRMDWTDAAIQYRPEWWC